MKLPKLNQSGIAHILAPLLFIAIFAGIGGYILMHSKAATVTNGCSASTPVPTISPNQDQAFANSVGYVTIDVAEPKCYHALAVEWYRNGHWLGALANHSPATAANGYKNHFSFPWTISHVFANSYHWQAKIHTKHGAFYAANNQGNRYTDLLVIGNGQYKDSKFIKPDNNVVWKRCDQTNFLRVEAKISWHQKITDLSLYGPEPPDPHGVEFINTSVGKPIHYKVYKHAYKDIKPNGGVPVVYDGWIKTLGYDYYPVGAACLKKGAYDWVARVISPKGDSYHLANSASDSSVYHLNITVQ